MFIKTANGASLLIGSIVNIEAIDSRHIPAREAETRPSWSNACIIVDALQAVRFDYDTEQLSGQIERHVLGWFETQADADAEMASFEEANTVTPFMGKPIHDNIFGDPFAS